ncbi:MAG TPA: transglycosylase domain-containing protein [Chloroflexia bacterium]|nr:transglycosylase domain-containing protein [Chloroflexia bacterium]
MLLAGVLLCALAVAVSLFQELPPARPVKAEMTALARSRGAAWVPLKQVPVMLQEAIIATEDARFYEHRGLDLIGTLRATIANIQAGHMVQGGSTLSQQLGKRYLDREDLTLERKLMVLGMAAKLELAYSKADILEMYLNSVYFGPYAYGIGNAAQVYFRKDVPDLTLAESTLLAGLPQAPSIYDPLHNLPRVKERQAVVITAMKRSGYLTDAQASAARVASTALDR